MWGAITMYSLADYAPQAPRIKHVADVLRERVQEDDPDRLLALATGTIKLLLTRHYGPLKPEQELALHHVYALLHTLEPHAEQLASRTQPARASAAA